MTNSHFLSRPHKNECEHTHLLASPPLSPSAAPLPLPVSQSTLSSSPIAHDSKRTTSASHSSHHFDPLSPLRVLPPRLRSWPLLGRNPVCHAKLHTRDLHHVSLPGRPSRPRFVSVLQQQTLAIADDSDALSGRRICFVQF